MTLRVLCRYIVYCSAVNVNIVLLLLLGSLDKLSALFQHFIHLASNLLSTLSAKFLSSTSRFFLKRRLVKGHLRQIAV